MTPEEEAAQAVLDAFPDRFDPAATGKVVALSRTYTAGAATGLTSVKVRVGESTLPCDWLGGFETAVLAGRAREGSIVLVHLTPDQCIVADVIVIGAKSLG